MAATKKQFFFVFFFSRFLFWTESSLSPRFLRVTKFKIRVTNWTISVIFRFPQLCYPNNRVKCQHLPGTGTRARGYWPSRFELSILALKIEHRPQINARMDLFSGWLLLNDHFSLLYFANQHKSQTFYTMFHYFVAFFTLPWATPNSVNFPVFPYHGEIVGLVFTYRHSKSGIYKWL